MSMQTSLVSDYLWSFRPLSKKHSFLSKMNTENTVFVGPIDINTFMELLVNTGNNVAVEKLSFVSKAFLASSVFWKQVVPKQYLCGELLRMQQQMHHISFPQLKVLGVHLGEGYGDVHVLGYTATGFLYRFLVCTCTLSGDCLRTFFLKSCLPFKPAETMCTFTTIIHKRNDYFIVAFVVSDSKCIDLSVYTPEGLQYQQVSLESSGVEFARAILAVEGDFLYVFGIQIFEAIVGDPVFDMWKMRICNSGEHITLTEISRCALTLPHLSSVALSTDEDDHMWENMQDALYDDDMSSGDDDHTHHAHYSDDDSIRGCVDDCDHASNASEKGGDDMQSMDDAMDNSSMEFTQDEFETVFSYYNDSVHAGNTAFSAAVVPGAGNIGLSSYDNQEGDMATVSGEVQDAVINTGASVCNHSNLNRDGGPDNCFVASLSPVDEESSDTPVSLDEDDIRFVLWLYCLMLCCCLSV